VLTTRESASIALIAAHAERDSATASSIVAACSRGAPPGARNARAHRLRFRCNLTRIDQSALTRAISPRLQQARHASAVAAERRRSSSAQTCVLVIRIVVLLRSRFGGAFRTARSVLLSPA
jgi:hypothetical protein